MLDWSLLLVVMVMGGGFLLRQRTEKQPAEKLLRLAQAGRLNTMGELAAGMAHGLNQP